MPIMPPAIPPRITGPLLTLKVHQAMQAAMRALAPALECSVDLDRSTTAIELNATHWTWQGQRFPYLESCKDRTIYHWAGNAFQPLSRYTTALIKLVPTDWGPPTFEIDGIKMLPTAKVSPYADAERKVALIQPRGKRVLDTCGGLGYFAAWCLQGQAASVLSYEKNPDVIWLRSLNPWSPQMDSPDVAARLTLLEGDIAEQVATFPGESFDAILHDPPRFGIAGELYSQVFYDHLARVMKRKGRLFHYTGTPNKLTSGRDVPNEVAKRLRQSGFEVKLNGDGVLAVKAGR
jgi:predicted methyltransferase